MKHLDKNNFYRVLEVEKMSQFTIKAYSRIHYRVLKEWKNPSDWIESPTKTIHLESRTTDCYWVVWSMLNKKELPIEFIRRLRLNNSEIILRNTLVDYEKLAETKNRILKEYSRATLKSLPSIVVRMCLYLGVNNLKDIRIKDISNAGRDGILIHDGYKTKLANLLYYMGYIKQGYRDSKLHHKIEERKLKLSDNWSEEMKEYIERFISNLYISRISNRKMETEKKNGLNLFANWYTENKNIDTIKDLSELTRIEWIDYIGYVNKLDGLLNKTKQNKLRALKDFIEWAQVKEPSIVPQKNFVSTEDYKSISYFSNNRSLAFDKREYGEKIIKYLINDFKTNSVREKFIKEAIIIAANSGMRISEIRRLEYGSCFYSEEEGLYKVILDYPDKIGQKFRPVYLTCHGYQAIERVEKLREEEGILNEKYNKRVERSFIHLFEYQGSDPLNSQSLTVFNKKVKMKLDLIDEEDNIVPGAMHAWRHFLASTVFKESNYNIGVVRYFLGHRDYDMSFQYLEEEKERVYNEIKNNKLSKKKFTGKGIETLLDVLINNNKNKEYDTLRELLRISHKLSDLIEFKDIKKVSFGYCLKPCDNANRCLRCRNFFLSNEDENEIIQSAKEHFELLCYKISLFNSPQEAILNSNIQKDISDLQILTSEIKNLDIDITQISEDLRLVM